MKPNDIYNLTPIKISHIVYPLWHHFPDIDFDSMDKDDCPLLQVRTYFDPYIDGERCSVVGAVYVHDMGWKPAMIFQHAGRGGRDYTEEYITDERLYKLVVHYLKSMENKPEEKLFVYDPNVDESQLAEFYSRRLCIVDGKLDVQLADTF